MADPMRIRAQAAGDKTTVRVLMAHEMESGQRKDNAGNLVPAWHISEVSATHNGKVVMMMLTLVLIVNMKLMMITVTTHCIIRNTIKSCG